MSDARSSATDAAPDARRGRRAITLEGGGGAPLLRMSLQNSWPPRTTPAAPAPSVRVGTIRSVPRISAFYGIVIEMYFGDHPPPHFHARYSGDAAKIEIPTGAVIAGALPGRALRLVREWIELHRDELEANWDRAVRFQEPHPIEPLR